MEEAVSAQIRRDHMSGLHAYTISQGTSTSQTKVTSWRSLVRETSNSLMGSPTISQYSSGTSDTGSSPGTRVDQHVYEYQLPIQPRDTTLQLYFHRMEKNLRTCHPTAIHTEAVNLARDILDKPMDAGSSIQSVVETIVKAGCRKVEYSRSCALVAHEIFCQLQSTSHEASISFRDSLISAVMKIFDGYYFKVNLWHLGGLDGLSSVTDEMINVAAFIGDLFALDLLHVSMVHHRILPNLAYADQVSTVHCRALYLFLLHAKAHIGPSIGLNVLEDVRRKLAWCARGSTMVHDRMPQLWVIECCTVIDRTIEQDRVAHGGGGIPYEWDMMISKGGWFSTLIS